jgi:multidrug efflux pump subunit AcrA (membrane-fusion protein)
VKPIVVVAPVVGVAAIVLAAVGLRPWVAERGPIDVAPLVVEPTTVHAAASAPASEGVLAVVVPRHEVDLSVAGFARVRRVAVEVGQHVDAGAPIVELDVREHQGDLASAQASARASRAELERLRIESQRSAAERTRAEGLRDFVAQEELERLRHDEGSARAGQRRAAADAQVRSAEIAEIARRIEDGVLKSPFAGLVVQRFADEGAVVGAGEPIVRLISSDAMVRFAVREDQPIAVGMPIVIVFGDVRVPSTITAIVPEIDPAARIVVAEADLSTDVARTHGLRVGARARVELPQ